MGQDTQKYAILARDMCWWGEGVKCLSKTMNSLANTKTTFAVKMQQQQESKQNSRDED
jgi:hypothetical protein